MATDHACSVVSIAECQAIPGLADKFCSSRWYTRRARQSLFFLNMTMPSTLGTRAPSSSLITFLRVQVDTLFLAPRCSSLVAEHGHSNCPRVHQNRSKGRGSSAQHFSTSGHQRMHIKSVCDFKLPRSTLGHLSALPSRLNLPRPGHPPCHGVKYMPGTVRRKSDDSHSYLSRMWSKNQKHAQKSLKPDDLPPLPRFIDPNGMMLGRNTNKATNELKLRCTEFDQHGKVTVVNGEFKKSELIAKVGRTLVQH